MGAQTARQVLVALRQITRASELHSRRLMRDFGLSIPQLVVLLAIEELDKVTVRQISEHISLSQATVTTILNRLEERGLVLRRRSSDDRRVVHQELTEAARAIMQRQPPVLQEGFMQRFGTLEAWEQTALLSALQRLAAMMEAEELAAEPAAEA